LSEPIYVAGCAYSVGRPHPVESLLREGILSLETLEDCRDRGITTFCAGGDSIAQMRTTVTARALASAGLSAEGIDCVVVADAMADAMADVPVELSEARVVLQAQDCAAFGAGIEAAAAQIATGSAENVLLLLTGQVRREQSRYNPELGTIFGDGAAACIVSSRPRGFVVIAAESWRESNLPRVSPATQPTGEQMLRDFQKLQNLLRLSYESAAISPAAVTALCGTHGSRIYLELMAEAAELPYERVYGDAMQEFGHVFACDNLIALAHYLEKHPGSERERIFCLVGWSPRAAGVVLLAELAYATTGNAHQHIRSP
jgi:3-oxoacyl-[acyl-carrier-protein] synthase III